MTPQDFLQWLASGLGANVVVSYLAERWAWFQSLTSEGRKWISAVFTALVAIAAYAVLTYVPADFWVLISPYWQIVVAVAGMYVGTQVFHGLDRFTRLSKEIQERL